MKPKSWIASSRTWVSIKSRHGSPGRGRARKVRAEQETR
jgi:hypothetical protein